MKIPKKNKIFLAPMEEVNDPAFRLLCKKAGAGLTWTPLSSPLSDRKLILDDKPTLQVFGTKDILKPSRLNLKKSSLEVFMKKYNKKVKGWDFNLGCPATNAKRHGFGAYLTDLKIIEEIIKEMKANTKKPLSIKIRKSPITDQLLILAEKYCDWIAIHPRTRAQGYSGEPDIKWAREFKKKSKIPVIYSGNVNEKNYKQFLKDFDYVMIGRASMGHPEIFSKITKTKYNKTFKDYLKLAKKYEIPFRTIKFQAMNFTKGLRGSRKQRLEIFGIKDLKGLKEFSRVLKF